MTVLLALDQGTSSSRAIVFTPEGRPLASAQRELTQHYPQPGWVEHDPLEIRDTQFAVAREALAKAGVGAAQVHAIGLTNQRETTVLWDRRSGQPLAPAIVWQDRRTEPACAALREAGHAAQVQARTGLVVDAYFSGTKLAWLLANTPGARAAAERGELAFGTIDSWLLWHLTGGRVHATDVSNASRTLLFDIERGTWDAELLALLDIPPSLLPEVHPSSHLFGHCDPAVLGAAVPIAGIAGDQQAALFGQACTRPGLAKNTYGTGCFLLMHTGATRRHSASGLITTRAAQAGPVPQFALEGSVFIGGAVVQWLRDGLGIIRHASEVQALAASVPDSGGVMLVPAFTGLGAPYWRADARGAILGLTRGTTAAHLARAAIESIAFQSAVLLQAMARDAAAQAASQTAGDAGMNAGMNAGGGFAGLQELRVDGGAAVNDLLMQFQAELLGLPVLRPAVVETTALGAAWLAGLATGLYASADELAGLWRVERRFEPGWAPGRAAERLAAWEAAVARC